MINSKNIEINNAALIYDAAISLVKEEVEHVLTKSPKLIREYLTHLSFSQGKYIRAVSIITCAESNEGYIPSDAVKIAAAIEILHLATLVHDDIIDNADIRRGKATLQSKYGKRTAVICGDYLLSLALKMVSKIVNKKDYMELELPDYISKLCLGELSQYINNNNINLSIFQYLKIISGKTAVLFEASFYAGAVIAGYNQKETKKYKQIGYYIGMIFQLSDDCIDFDTDVKEAMKPVQSDYEQGVITLPLIHAFEELHDFKERASHSFVNREEINAAVEKTEGVKFTRIFIERYYNKAMKKIEELELTKAKKDRLIAILNKASRNNAGK